jgi:hypothetical protein
MHTMPPNTDRPINCAMVVGCAVSATRNHLKLHEPRRLKVLFCNIHAKTRKLWKHSAMRLAAFRTNAAHQFTRRDVHCTLPGSRAYAHARRLVLAPRPPSRSPPTYDPHSTRCTAGCHTSRDFVPWRFSDAGRRSAWIASSCRHPKTCTCADINKRAQQFSKQSAKMTPNPSETKGRGTIPPECSNLCRRASAALGGRCTRGPALSNLGEGLDLHQKVRASQSRHGHRRTLR